MFPFGPDKPCGVRAAQTKGPGMVPGPVILASGLLFSRA